MVLENAEPDEFVEETLTALASKRASFLSVADSVRILAIGSSHGDYAFDPGQCPGSFNFCGTSQDLRHSAMLYDYCSAQTSAIRHVVLFYSVFSPGFTLERSSERSRCAVYKGLFAPHAAYSIRAIDATYAQIEHRLAQPPLGSDDYADRGFFRSNGRYFLPSGPAGELRDRTESHLKHNARAEADIYLVKILQMARERGHVVTVALPPARSDYRNYLSRTSDDLFRTIVELKNNFDYEFNFINFFDDLGIDDGCFGDSDHLLPEGRGSEIVSRALSLALQDAPSETPS